MRRTKLHIVLPVLMALAGCGAAPVAKSTAAGSSDSTASNLSLADLQRVRAQLLTKQSAGVAELAFLGDASQKMCERLQQMRSECMPSMRIVPDATDKILACVADDTDLARNDYKFNVHLAGAPNAEFVILADSTYQSAPFREGDTAITWSTTFSTNQPSPRLYDFKTLRLKVTTGTLPALTNLVFELHINDHKLFDATSLVANDATSYSIKTDGFLTLRRSAACRVPAAEIDDIQQTAQKETPAAPTATPAPEANVTTAALQKEVTDLQTAVATQFTNLQRERDREGTLSKELLGDSAAGCFATQPVKKLEFIISGAHLDKGALFETDVAAVMTGSPAQMLFTFGQNFVYTDSNEETNSLFASPGDVISTNFAAHQIADIEYLSLTKGGLDYLTGQRCTQVWIFGKTCVAQNWETKRYRLDSLEIKINDEVFYQQDAINHTFEGQNLTWEDRNIALNPQYLTLMARSDCPTN